MSDKPEPLAAILAEMRDGIHTGRADIIDYVNDRLRSYADRIEAAAERERDEDRQLAAIAESDEAFARCARCDRPERVPGNASSCAPMSLEEAIEHAESRADETPCGQAHAQLAGWLRELRYLRNAPGNAAALLEAIDKAKCVLLVAARFATDDAFTDAEASENLREVDWDGALAEIDAALSAPVRNCDRFATADEAEREYCRKAFFSGFEDPVIRAAFRWAFATVEGGDHA